MMPKLLSSCSTVGQMLMLRIMLNGLPFHIAAGERYAGVTRVLLSHEARLDLKGPDGRTAIDIAISNNHQEMARMLLDHFPNVTETEFSADPSVDKEYSADLSVDEAIRSGNLNKARLLMENGASLALRETRSIQLRTLDKTPAIVGSDNEYLKILCLKMEDLRTFIHQTPTSGDDHTGSDRAFLNGSRWLLTCLTQHSDCINSEGPLPVLPSRVIDVGLQDGSQDPVLLCTRGQRGRYVALSHRWVGSHITKTTTRNLAERMKRIEFGCLTKTIRDAVTVTRRFGVRYLWIDALCIIQDSHSDWSVEACDMANIYRNALFTIAAAAASDHSQGCFAKGRQRRWPAHKSPLGSRAWILQEQLLPPRIIKYSVGHLE